MIALGYTLAALPVLIAVYSYAGYPLVLWLIARLKPDKPLPAITDWPRVSVVLPAYNEAHQIAGALDAVLAQDYPADRLQILVMSDASTDATDRIVSEYAARGVELMRMPERSGKTKMENLASARLRGDIIVNSDSSIRLHPSAVRELVARMSDPSVGVASGRDVSISAMDQAANITESKYVDYEMRVRRLETRAGGIVGASGSCYAIRSELHRIPIRDDLSRDFASALTARLHGRRAVSVDEAICFVPRTQSLEREYRRKVRTITRGMATLYNRRELLNPFKYGAFAWKLFSHKICRWLLPVSLVPGIVGLGMIATSHLWARLVLVAGAAVAGLALIGTVWPAGRRMPRLISLAAFGVAANVAVLSSLSRFLGGDRHAIWEPTRRST